jgi:hypothetical protein
MGRSRGLQLPPGLSRSERPAPRTSRSNTGFCGPTPPAASRAFTTCHIWWSAVRSPLGDLAPGVTRLGIPRIAIACSQTRNREPLHRNDSHSFSAKACVSRGTGWDAQYAALRQERSAAQLHCLALGRFGRPGVDGAWRRAPCQYSCTSMGSPHGASSSPPGKAPGAARPAWPATGLSNTRL